MTAIQAIDKQAGKQGSTEANICVDIYIHIQKSIM